MTPDEINQLRLLCRQRRRQLGLGAQLRAAHRLQEQLLHSTAYRDSTAIAFYLATDGEVNCLPLLKQAWKDGKACYLPVIDTLEPRLRRMYFRRYTPGCALVNNRFGIAEPASGKFCLPQHLDMVLLPLVAFDQTGNRIGMGGGYYDRAFAREPGVPRPTLVGLAHRVQQLARIEAQPWDVRLDSIAVV